MRKTTYETLVEFFKESKPKLNLLHHGFDPWKCLVPRKLNVCFEIPKGNSFGAFPRVE